MTKEELIKKYYGEDYKRAKENGFGIDEDGFSSFYAHHNETFLHGYEIFNSETLTKVRPLGLGEELEKLNNNNGWIKIESEFDAPDEDVLVCNINGNKVAFFHDACKLFGKKFTHYQPIVRPKPPIY